MPGITRYEKPPQPVREINPNPAEGRRRFGSPCLERETDYRRNTLPVCLRIYRPGERALKVRPPPVVQNADTSRRSISNSHQGYCWAGSDALGNPIYYSRGHLRFCPLAFMDFREGETHFNKSSLPFFDDLLQGLERKLRYCRRSFDCGIFDDHTSLEQQALLSGRKIEIFFFPEDFWGRKAG